MFQLAKSDDHRRGGGEAPDGGPGEEVDQKAGPQQGQEQQDESNKQ